ncbi:MAG: YnbE family lipoprotein [Dongiaceae bacterium]
MTDAEMVREPASSPPVWRRRICATIWVLAALPLAACQPTVQLQAPEDPIVINLNVKIEQEVRVRIEQDAERDIETNPDIF